MARIAADEMVEIVRDNLGGETTETMSSARILRFINQSYVEVCSANHFPQLETSTTITTSSGTAEYELSASDVLKVLAVVDSTNYSELQEVINRHQYTQYTQGDTSSSTGVPVYWFISGVGDNSRYQMTFYPTPDGTYTITVFYTKRPTDLATSPTATSPIIPEPWDDSLITRATARGWRQLGDNKRAAEWMQLANQNDAAARNSSQELSTVPSRAGSVVGQSWR